VKVPPFRLLEASASRISLVVFLGRFLPPPIPAIPSRSLLPPLNIFAPRAACDKTSHPLSRCQQTLAVVYLCLVTISGCSDPHPPFPSEIVGDGWAHVPGHPSSARRCRGSFFTFFFFCRFFLTIGANPAIRSLPSRRRWPSRRAHSGRGRRVPGFGALPSLLLFAELTQNETTIMAFYRKRESLRHRRRRFWFAGCPDAHRREVTLDRPLSSLEHFWSPFCPFPRLDVLSAIFGRFEFRSTHAVPKLTAGHP